MPSLIDLIDAKVKSPSYEARFAGNLAKDAISIEIQSSLDDRLSEATIKMLSDPRSAPETFVNIRQGYDGHNSSTFSGYIDAVEYIEYEAIYSVSCRDVLKKAMDTFLVQEVAFGVDQSTGHYFYSTWEPGINGGEFHVHEYSDLATLHSNHPETAQDDNISNQGAKAHAVVQWLLIMCGLHEGSQAPNNIQVDDTNFYIGDLTPAKFHMESIYDACQQIAQLIGWRLYADAQGTARFRARPRNPSGYTAWTYTDKGNPYNIYTISKNLSNTDLRTYVEVRGASGISYVARGTSPYLGNTPYRGVLISSELIDTPGIASFMANRVLNDLNRLKTTVTMEVDGNPTLTPGSTLRTTSRVATGNYLLKDYQTTMSAENGYKMNLAAETYPGDSTFVDAASGVVIADFTYIQVAVFGDPKWVVTFDGSSSYSDSGAIVQWVWSWPDSTTTTSANPTAYFTFDYAAISNGNSQPVTLTVTDSLGHTGFVTKDITSADLAAATPLKYRQLYGALGNKAVGSLDGGLTWNTINFPAISVAASNFVNGGQFVPSGYAIFGTSDSKIHKTVDGLITSVNVYTTVGANVNDVHVSELDSRYCLAGDSAGKVYSSRDGGGTWRQIGSLGTAIRQVRHAYTDYNYVLAVAAGSGNTWESFNLGSNWAKISQLSDVDVNWNDAGTATNYYAHTKGVRSLVGGVSSNLVFPASGQPNIKAMTVAIDRDDGVMAVDTDGQHWNAAGGVFSATQNNSANKSQHMLRDGELPIVVYYANASGIGKSLDDNITMSGLYYPGGVDGKMVAYGPLTGGQIPGNLILHSQAAVNNAVALGPYPLDTTAGIFLSTASGWVKVNRQADSVTTMPGYVFGYKNTGGHLPSTVSYIDAVVMSASGLPTVINPILYGPNDVGIQNVICSRHGPPSTRTVAVSCDIGTKQRLHAMYEFIDRAPYADDAIGFSAYTEVDSSSATHPSPMEPNLDRFLIWHKPALFSTEDYSIINMSILDATPVKVHFSAANNDSSDLIWYPDVKFMGAFWGIASWNSDHGVPPEFEGIRLTKGDSQGTGVTSKELLQSDVDTVLGGTYGVDYAGAFDSAIIKSDLIYADDTKVKRCSAYGQGVSTELFDIATHSSTMGDTIWSITVTHDVDNTKDYICVLLKLSGKVFYSVDGGDTWIAGPPVVFGSTFSVPVVYFVDTPNGGSLL